MQKSTADDAALGGDAECDHGGSEPIPETVIAGEDVGTSGPAFGKDDAEEGDQNTLLQKSTADDAAQGGDAECDHGGPEPIPETDCRGGCGHLWTCIWQG